MSIKAAVHKKGTLSISNLLENTRKKPDFYKVGAIATFIGVVRGETKEGKTVKGLELEAYKGKADEVLQNICKELQAKESIVDVQIHHFTGKFHVGEELVYVLVAGGHRNNVFPVLEEAVERYKREAPIFKKETITDKKGAVKSYWVNEGKTE
ncbi:MAG: molybdenum cofactor biosynthesis protein MoaE [Candidatus Bathyarchaeota archaeon]|nr:molybdenum cofactor biosynthesis protein MoaE [Candidatus Bathyarchaeota archaeon]